MVYVLPSGAQIQTDKKNANRSKKLKIAKNQIFLDVLWSSFVKTVGPDRILDW
jgi:hypothetical protein